MTRKAYFSIPVLLIVAVLIFLLISTSSSTSHLSKSTGSVAVLIKGGQLNRPNSETGGTEKLTIKSFYLDKNLTTVAEFDEFVKKTGYVTEADKFGNSAVFVSGHWELVDGADYQYPFGKDKAKAAPNHRVTQVSWNDAVAYAKWKGKRLPTEAEWEFAATNGGKSKRVYPWGNDLRLNGKYQANVWQGTFPTENTQLDGYEFTSPVASFPANELGIYDLGGNVWQWCSDAVKPTPEEAAQDTASRHPTKGASFLTDVLADNQAKIFEHSSSTSETGIVHTGFRLAKDVK